MPVPTDGRRRPWRVGLAVGALTLLPLAGACSGSVSIGEKGVSKAKVEEKIGALLEEQVGRAPDDITCPDSLAAEVGATMRCTLTDGDTYLGVTAKVTSVDGSDVGFNVVVDDGPTTAPS